MQYFQLIVNSMHWVTSLQKRMVSNVLSEVITPLEKKVAIFRKNNRSLMENFAKELRELKSRRKKLMYSQEIYYKRCSINERFQMEFEDEEDHSESSQIFLKNMEDKVKSSKFAVQDSQTKYSMDLVR